MKTKKLIVFFIAFLTVTQSFGQNQQEFAEMLNTVTTAVPFLLIAPDARGGGMGDIGVATSPDPMSAHWNPAKFAFVDKDIGFGISYTPWLRNLVPDINLAYCAGYRRLGRNQTLGASLLYFSLGDITFTNEVGAEIGHYNPHEFAIDASYARKFTDYISGAMAIRFIRSNLTGGLFVGGVESKPGISIATDVSSYYMKDIRVFKKDALASFGLNISNIGSKIRYTSTGESDFIPINFRLGSGLTTELDEYNTLAVFVDFNKLLVPTPPKYDTNNIIIAGKDPDVSVVTGIFMSFTDAPGGFNEEIKEINWSVGLEYWYNKQFAVRAGYFHEPLTKGNRQFFTVGAGLKYNVFGIDFAYLIPTEQRHPLENTLRFTLLFDFAGLKAENQEK